MNMTGVNMTEIKEIVRAETQPIYQSIQQLIREDPWISPALPDWLKNALPVLFVLTIVVAIAAIAIALFLLFLHYRNRLALKKPEPVEEQTTELSAEDIKQLIDYWIERGKK